MGYREKMAEKDHAQEVVDNAMAKGITGDKDHDMMKDLAMGKTATAERLEALARTVYLTTATLAPLISALNRGAETIVIDSESNTLQQAVEAAQAFMGPETQVVKGNPSKDN